MQKMKEKNINKQLYTRWPDRKGNDAKTQKREKNMVRDS